MRAGPGAPPWHIPRVRGPDDELGAGDRSPDLIDALVWALHELTSGEEVQEIIVYDSDYQISPI